MDVTTSDEEDDMDISDDNQAVVILMAAYEQAADRLPDLLDAQELAESRARDARAAVFATELRMSEIRAVLEKLGFEPDAD